MEPLRQRKLADNLKRASERHQEINRQAAEKAATHPAFVAVLRPADQPRRPEGEA